MYPVLDRSIRRRGIRRAIGQKCPKPPSGGEAAEKRHMPAVNGPRAVKTQRFYVDREAVVKPLKMGIFAVLGFTQN